MAELNLDDWVNQGAVLYSKAVEAWQLEVEALRVQQQKVADTLATMNKIGALLGKPAVTAPKAVTTPAAPPTVAAPPAQRRAKPAPAAHAGKPLPVDPDRSLDALSQLERETLA